MTRFSKLAASPTGAAKPETKKARRRRGKESNRTEKKRKQGRKEGKKEKGESRKRGNELKSKEREVKRRRKKCEKEALSSERATAYKPAWVGGRIYERTKGNERRNDTLKDESEVLSVFFVSGFPG